MKQNILIALGVILLVTLWIQYIFPKHNETDRYSIISNNNMLTILVDKKTGLTWRNSICDGKNNVPGCWTRMYTLDQENFNIPEGEALIRTKLWPSYVKKTQKKQMEQEREAQKKERIQQNYDPNKDSSLMKVQ